MDAIIVNNNIFFSFLWHHIIMVSVLLKLRKVIEENVD